MFFIFIIFIFFLQMCASDVVNQLTIQYILHSEFTILFLSLLILSLTDNIWLIDASFGSIFEYSTVPQGSQYSKPPAISINMA